MKTTSQDLAELYGELKPRMSGTLKSNLFKLLDSLEDTTDKLVIIKRFINFMSWYKGQVDSGLADEEMLIAGLYPATKQVKEVSMEKIMEVINAYEKEHYGTVDAEPEFVSDDLVDEEGGE